jgi:hypothetical protein
MEGRARTGRGVLVLVDSRSRRRNGRKELKVGMLVLLLVPVGKQRLEVVHRAGCVSGTGDNLAAVLCTSKDWMRDATRR